MKVPIRTLDIRGRRAAVRRAAQRTRQAGHEAVLAAPHRFEGFVRDQGGPLAGIDDCSSVATDGAGRGHPGAQR